MNAQALDPQSFASRSNVSLRLVRIALREGKAPSVNLTRKAIICCARLAETYRDAGAAAEAMRIAPFAVSRAGGAA